MDNCRILKIIKCNQKLFMPVANVECVICIFKKYTKDENKEDYETEMVDYSDDRALHTEILLRSRGVAASGFLFSGRTGRRSRSYFSL